ncbi:MAG: YgjV family protein [Clostridia bacterium]|nr:YgjV family protein [Clostridia bacterium]
MLDHPLFIQGIGFVGTALYFISFQCRDNRNLFRVQFLSYLFYTVHLILLGAVTGGISYMINTVRSFCLGSSWKLAHSKTMCAVICLMQMAALFFTWSGWLSVLPVAANIAATIAGYTHSARKVRLVGMLVNSPLWMVYNILVGSWAGILDEAVSEVSMIVSIIRYGWRNLDAGSHSAREAV